MAEPTFLAQMLWRFSVELLFCWFVCLSRFQRKEAERMLNLWSAVYKPGGCEQPGNRYSLSRLARSTVFRQFEFNGKSTQQGDGSALSSSMDTEEYWVMGKENVRS